ncbi:MAG: hypothetical protein ACM3XP_07690, partial [Nitrososphaerales archaeon]
INAYFLNCEHPFQYCLLLWLALRSSFLESPILYVYYIVDTDIGTRIHNVPVESNTDTGAKIRVQCFSKGDNI